MGFLQTKILTTRIPGRKPFLNATFLEQVIGMKTRYAIVAVVVSVLAFSSPYRTNAAEISIQPVIGGFFDTAFDPIPPVPSGYYPGGPVIVQVNVMMRVVSLAPGEDGFGQATFDFDWSSAFPSNGIEPSPFLPVWNPENYPIDTNGAAPGGNQPLFFQNEDLGPQDLKAIYVAMGPGAFTHPDDPRRNIGEPGSTFPVPLSLGSVFFEWNGQSQALITLSNVTASAKLTDGQIIDAAVRRVRPVRLGYIPEPTSFALLAGCLAPLALRRRT